MIASQTRQLCVVHCVTHGVLKVTTMPTIEATIPTRPLPKSTQSGATRTSSYFSTRSRAYVSKDGHTTFAEIYPAGTPDFSSSVHVKEVRAQLKAATPSGETRPQRS